MDKFMHNKAYSYTFAYNFYRKKISGMQSVQKLLRNILHKKKIVLKKHELYHHILKYLSYLASTNCYRY